MAIFVDGDNIALVPGTSLPVAVNTVNGGWDKPAGTDVPATNPAYYVDNADPNNSALPPYKATIPVYDMQYDGTTVLITVVRSISTNTTYRIKIAIADASDADLDSAVLIKAQVPCP